MSYNRFRRTAFNLAAETFWRMPGCFGVARLLGPSYSLRCVVFHHISAAESPLTTGMNVSTTPGNFEAALRFLTTYYSPVRLEDVLAEPDGRRLPPRAVLVTFDDAYASVVEVAAPLCFKYGVPAVFFVTAAFLDNRGLAPDNPRVLCSQHAGDGDNQSSGPYCAAHREPRIAFPVRRLRGVSFLPLHWRKGKHFSKR